MLNKESAHCLTIQGDDLLYNLIRSKKRKYSLSMKIDVMGRLKINVPFKTQDKAIEDFIISKYAWIKSKSAEKQKLEPLPQLTYADGEKHWYMGVEYPLKLITSVQTSVEIHNDYLCVYHRKNASIKNILCKWYKNTTLEYLQRRTLQLAKIHRLPSVKAIKVRFMKARWGSCSSQSIITYNIHLIKTSLENIDYVILHELCHLVQPNHSALFYKLQTQLNPNWKHQKHKLNQQGYKLIR